MSHNHFGVKYPNGTWSGPISPTAKDLKPYARLHHGTIYEAGTAEDPGRLCQRQGEPWVFDDAPRGAVTIAPVMVSGDPWRHTTITAAAALTGHDFAADQLERIEPEDIATAKADIENDTRKCYPDDLAAKFGA